ncbi:mucin-5AC-like [Aedes albopictus]|uniref:Mucin-5AC n=1 Tax=Aedes albopictus TaxID=7160 RepID=A0ABM1ZZ47_AEDAL
MKHKSILLLCLLVGPALARPNMEPIYYRSNSNPLEVTEELIPTTNALPLVASGGESDHQTSTGASSGGNSNSNPATQATPTVAPGTTLSAVSTTTTSPAPSTLAQDHISSPLFRRPENPLKTKIGTSGYVVSTSTKILTSAGLHHSSKGTVGEAKANDQIVTYDNFASHAGVAEPLSEEEYHKELSKANDRVRIRLQPTTTTPKEGLSTWVLLSESNSPTSTESKKEIVTTTRPPTTTTRRPATTIARKPSTTARRRPTTSTRATTVSEEKKEKVNKFMTRIKVTDGPKPKLEDSSPKPEIIVKKTKKPFTPTSAKTTTTTTTTAAPTTTTTELTVTESAFGPTTSYDNADDNAVETSTFLILEPKDAQFDLPEDRSPAKVAKKKVTRKPTTPATATKKKPVTKKKKPEEKEALRPSEKKPPAKSKPISTQIMNYLSREVVPTVGVGLVGLVITAGLASYFLGSPLTAALRRSDETNRKDDIYYSNYEDYATSDGQNEEEVFGKLIAGMPDRSYYRNTLRRRVSQPARTGHQYGNYHVQSYSVNKYPHINYRNQPRPAYAGTPEMYTNYNNRQVQAKSHNEFYYNTPPSFYTKSSSPVYVAPESTTLSTTTTTTTHMPLTSASSASDEMTDSEQDQELLPNPAAYTAEHSPEHHAQYVVGSVYHQDNSMIDIITSAPVPEHGPRRRKRDIASAENEIDNEIDNEISGSGDKKPEAMTTSTGAPATVTTSAVGIDTFDPTTEGEKGDANPPVPAGERPISWSELIRNTVEMKLVVGINLLQDVTSMFQRYLSGVQHRVEEHFNHTSSVVQQ